MAQIKNPESGVSVLSHKMIAQLTGVTVSEEIRLRKKNVLDERVIPMSRNPVVINAVVRAIEQLGRVNVTRRSI